MKIKLIVIGKTDEKYLKQGLSKYEDRLKHYAKYEMLVIPDIKKGKKQNIELQQEEEGKLILSKVQNSDHFVLLDERGKTFSSVQYAKHLEKKMVGGISSIVFVIGGPFGFSKAIYDRANDKLSLSAMTLSHQMIRLFFVEAIYRTFTIIRGEKYHNEGGGE
jgi:23S rRNA (pseudouridine1915-N3)-methyltransferase